LLTTIGQGVSGSPLNPYGHLTTIKFSTPFTMDQRKESMSLE
jgi:hypothetical protein